MQDRRVIAYISRKLRRHEENYATHDLELLAIVYALRVWRHYLIGWKFKIKTDHCGLQHIFTQSNLNARQRRWSEFLSEYDFEITYIKGTVNRVADALSRRPHILSVLPLQTNLREKILIYSVTMTGTKKSRTLLDKTLWWYHDLRDIILIAMVY